MGHIYICVGQFERVDDLACIASTISCSFLQLLPIMQVYGPTHVVYIAASLQLD